MSKITDTKPIEPPWGHDSNMVMGVCLSIAFVCVLGDIMAATFFFTALAFLPYIIRFVWALERIAKTLEEK